MFDMSWGEIMVIGGVALIVIGPKELPRALRTLGQMTTKVRRLAGEFRGQFDEAMREAELEDVKREVEGLNRSVASATATAFDPIQTIRDELKGAVEQKPAIAMTPAEAELFGTNPGPLAPTAEIAPAGHWQALPEPEAGLNPEIQPLVPMPITPPAAPAPPVRPSDAAA